MTQQSPSAIERTADEQYVAYIIAWGDEQGVPVQNIPEHCFRVEPSTDAPMVARYREFVRDDEGRKVLAHGAGGHALCVDPDCDGGWLKGPWQSKVITVMPPTRPLALTG